MEGREEEEEASKKAGELRWPWARDSMGFYGRSVAVIGRGGGGAGAF